VAEQDFFDLKSKQELRELVLKKGEISMRPRKYMLVSEIAIIVGMLAAFGGVVLAAQDKYSVKVPNGLAFSEFRGYEDWRTVAVSQSGDLIEVILGNPVMIDAYRAGIPGNGKHFPDGAKMAKIHWKAKKSAEAPDPTTVPDTLHDIDFMVKDSKRFSNTGGWGFAQFNHDTASDIFTPEGSGSNCGYSCHTIVAAKDYVFTAYGKR
jgi:Cytochrome P460